MQNKTRTINRLIAKALRLRELGKCCFQSASEAADQARGLGVPLNTKIGPLPRFKRGPQIPEFARVVDNWPPDVTHAYRPARFDKFTVEEWKEPKTKKAASAPTDIPPPGFVAGAE